MAALATKRCRGPVRSVYSCVECTLQGEAPTAVQSYSVIIQLRLCGRPDSFCQDVLARKPKEFWDYEKMIDACPGIGQRFNRPASRVSVFEMLQLISFCRKVKWGNLDDYEVTQKIGRGKYSASLRNFARSPGNSMHNVLEP